MLSTNFILTVAVDVHIEEGVMLSADKNRRGEGYILVHFMLI